MVCKFYFETREVTGMFVKEEDYLKVVEEKERYKNLITLNEEKILKELKEKDEEIEMLKEIVIDGGVNYSNLANLYNERQELKEELKEKINDLKALGSICNEQRVEIRESIEVSNYNFKEFEKKLKEKDEEIERLKKLNEPETQYEDWCELKYWFINSVTGQTNMYRQHMNYEDACELIGMDSDNWTEFNVVKYKKEVK